MQIWDLLLHCKCVWGISCVNFYVSIINIWLYRYTLQAHDWTTQVWVAANPKNVHMITIEFLKGLPWSCYITSCTHRFGTVFSPVCSLGVANGTLPRSQRGIFVIWATRSPFHAVHLHSGGVTERSAASHSLTVWRSTLPWLPSTPLP